MPDNNYSAIYWLEKKFLYNNRKKIAVLGLIDVVILIAMYLLKIFEAAQVMKLGSLVFAMTLASHMYEMFLASSPRYLMVSLGSIQPLIKVKSVVVCLLNVALLLIVTIICLLADRLWRVGSFDLKLWEWSFCIIENLAFAVFFLLVQFYVRNRIRMLISVGFIVVMNVLILLNRYNSMVASLVEALLVLLIVGAGYVMYRTVSNERVWIGGRK